MRKLTLFVAYQKVRERLSFIQAQQGGDYSARRKKAERQERKLAERLTTKLFEMDVFEQMLINAASPKPE